MVILLFVLVAFFFLVIAYMINQAFQNNVLHHTIELKGQEEQITLFFISDIHLRKINKEMIEQLKKPIHAVIIGGDLADKRTPVDRIQENLKLLQTLGPIYFVWGNNDREIGEKKLRELFSTMNVQIIENDSIILPGSQNKCRFVGIDDVSTMYANIDKAFRKCKTNENIIFISHNPQVFKQVRQRYSVNVMLGGHYHGGQIRLGPFGQKPLGSFEVKDGIATLISNGYGTTMIPMRLGAKPECHMIDLNFME